MVTKDDLEATAERPTPGDEELLQEHDARRAAEELAMLEDEESARYLAAPRRPAAAWSPSALEALLADVLPGVNPGQRRYNK
jgi:hypothetical protein